MPSVRQNTRVPRPKLAITPSAIGAARQRDRRVLVIGQTGMGRGDLEVADIKPLGNVARQLIVAEHGDTLADGVAMAALLAFRQYQRRAFDILFDRSGWRDIGHPFQQQITLCEDFSHRYLLVPGARGPPRPGADISPTDWMNWTASCSACCGRRSLAQGYCTTSPCSARSRPSRSVSSETRRPTNILTMNRMIRLT